MPSSPEKNVTFGDEEDPQASNRSKSGARSQRSGRSTNRSKDSLGSRKLANESSIIRRLAFNCKQHEEAAEYSRVLWAQVSGERRLETDR